MRSELARRPWPYAAAFAVAALGAGLLLSAQAKPADPSAGLAAKDRAAIEAVVRQYILANPEIIPEAINRMQEREVAKLLASNRAEIEKPFAGAWAGAKDGDVVLVEFFDYACPYCRQSAADVRKLLADDPKLKVVFRDFPVLGEASEQAAMASLSAARQGRYVAFYERMFSTPGRPSNEKVVQTVRAAGLDERRAAGDLSDATLRAEIQRNLELGRALGLTGTPTYVVGDRILSGAVGYDALKQAVADARARSG